MSDAAAETGPAFGDLRRAARAIRSAEHGRQAIRTINPRGVSGLFWSRPPLAVVLYHAALEGRLVWYSAEAFAVLEAPAANGLSPVAGRPRARWLGRLDRWWDVIVAAIPSAGLLLLASLATLAYLGTGWPWLAMVAIILVLLVSGYVCILMISLVLRGGYWLIRVLDLRGRALAESTVDSFRSQNWSVPLCHALTRAQAEEVVIDAVRALSRVAAPRRHGSNPGGPDRGDAEALLFLEKGATTAAARDALRAAGVSPPLADELPVRVIAPAGGGRLRKPDADQSLAGAVSLMLLSTAIVLSIEAWFVADWERDACRTAGCAGHPASYLDALYWLVNRLFFHDPAGLSPATGPGRALGFSTGVLGLTLLGLLVQAGRGYRRTLAKRADAFEKGVQQDMTSRTRVLVLVATRAERDAMIAAGRAANGQQKPRAEHLAYHTVWRLGMVSRAEILLAQSQQSADGPSGMTLTADRLINECSPDYIILTGICYGLRESEDGQHTGDILISKQLHDMNLQKVHDGADGTPVTLIRSDKVTASPTLLSRCEAATVDWNGPAVHTGPILSLNTLVNSPSFRQELKNQAPDAVGGEMEGAGVYAAAAKKKTDWILVKGISDWGRDKTDEAQVTAAGNAARFVLHVIAGGGLDRPAGR